MAKQRQVSLFESWSRVPVSNDDELQETPTNHSCNKTFDEPIENTDSDPTEGQSSSHGFLDHSATEGENETRSSQPADVHNLLDVVLHNRFRFTLLIVEENENKSDFKKDGFSNIHGYGMGIVKAM